MAAGRSGGNPEAGRYGNGVHFDVRRLTSVCDGPPRHRLVRCSRGKGLDRDSPVLRIRMETTRASLLWQAAAVRPEPERGCLVLEGVWTRSRCIARVWDDRILLY